MEELRNAAELSQHPVFAFPLYDGVLPAPAIRMSFL
jgi:hypothetical protein